jgi:photosystem II stability/assembly factor-like uncharacterized protein
MDGRLAGVVLLAAVALAGCAGVSPRPAPATVTARVTAQAPVWLDLPQMTSATTGWTLRWTQWGRSETELVHTTDGGRTWTDVTPPAMTTLLAGGVPPVLRVLDGEHAWVAICCTEYRSAAPTEVFATADGGRTWTESEPMAGTSLSAPSSLGVAGPDAWLVLTSEMARGPATFSQLYRTDDGGRHWSRLSTNLPPDCDNAELTVATASALWMSCAPSRPALLVSRDGGTHWTAQVLPALPCADSCGSGAGPQFFGQTGFMVVGGTAAGTASQPSLLVSRNLGLTWQRATLPRGAGTFPDVQFLSPSDGIVMPQVPEGNRVPAAYITVNGGRTWTAAPQGLRGTDAELLSFDFVTARTWFAWYGQPQTQEEAPVLFQTRNSGRTWTSTTARFAGSLPA